MKEEYPFSQKLVRSEFYDDSGGRLESFRKDPRWVVRNIDLAQLERQVDNRGYRLPHPWIREIDWNSPEAKERVLKLTERCKKTFEQLHKRYKIPVAPLEYVLGKNNYGYPSLYVLTRRIEGVALMDVLQVGSDSRLYERLPEHYERLAMYLQQHIRSLGTDTAELFASDVYANRQYVFGSLPENRSSKEIWLVDTDPWFGRNNEVECESSVKELTGSIDAFVFVRGSEMSKRILNKLKRIRESLNNLAESALAVSH